MQLLSCPLPRSSQVLCHLVKDIIYNVSFPNTAPSAPAGTAAYGAEAESKERGSGKPQLFVGAAAAQFRGKL